MNGTSDRLRFCVYLGDQDRKHIEQIKDRLQLDSSALAIRVALSDLAKRLGENKPPLMDTNEQPLQDDAPHTIPGFVCLGEGTNAVGKNGKF